MIVGTAMKTHPAATGAKRLEDLPYIGKSLAADLRSIGIQTPAEFARVKPLAAYDRLADPMGKRHDPCVLHTFLSVEHFLKTGESIPWWKFTEEGKRLIRENPVARAR